jgi:hypothetical protein
VPVGQADARGQVVRRFSEVFAALALLTSCGGPGTGETPTPAATTPVPTATLASRPPPEVVLSRGQGTIRGTFMFDFERGAEAGPVSADVWWEQVDSTRRFLVPRNGAGLAVLSGVSFENASRAVLAAQRYSEQRLDGSDGPSNELTPGSAVAIRTRGGHLARMRVNSEGFDLGVSWVTFL